MIFLKNQEEVEEKREEQEELPREIKGRKKSGMKQMKRKWQRTKRRSVGEIDGL